MSDHDPPVGQVDIRRMSLRGGGWIGYSDDALYVATGDDDDRIRIPNDAVELLTLNQVEWDIAVMSLLLVGVGGYVVATMEPLVGVIFAAVGLFSLYRTYRRRYELTIRVENRPKPVSVFPEHPIECHETLAEQVGLR